MKKPLKWQRIFLRSCNPRGQLQHNLRSRSFLILQQPANKSHEYLITLSKAQCDKLVRHFGIVQEKEKEAIEVRDRKIFS